MELTKFDLVSFTGVIAAIILLFFVWKREKNKLFAVLRSASIICLLAMLAQPSLLLFNKRERPVAAVCYDISSSMSLAGRIESMKAFEKRYSGELNKIFDIRSYVFSSASRAVKNTQDFEKLNMVGATDIQNSIDEVRRDLSGGLSAILVLTDGNQTAGIRQNSTDVPVFAIAPDNGQKIRDVAIESVRVSDFAFKDTPVTIGVKLRITGWQNEKITLRLKRQNEIITSKTIEPLGGDKAPDTEISFVPSTNGTMNYSIEAVPLKDEISKENNSKSFTLEVMREKIRILYICGQPGPEYAFLRHTLKSDPMVELVSFVILRNHENIALVPENDLALIPFPVNDIFTKDLFKFDVLILQNFTYFRFGFASEHLTNIKRWVTENGGGLLMTAGSNAFAGGGWDKTPVADVLPVLCEAPQDNYSEDFFKPRIKDLEHSIMRLSDDKKQNAEFWDGIGEIEGCQPIRKRAGAQVLIEHPWNSSPVLAVWEKDKGRVAALGTDSTWRWSLNSPSPEIYTKFWKNIIRYLSRGSDSQPLRASFDRPRYFQSQDFSLKIIGEKSGILQGYYIDPMGSKHVLSLKDWSANGTFDYPGVYRFNVSLSRNAMKTYTYSFSKEVSSEAAAENSNLSVNDDFLNKITLESGGIYFPAGQFSPEKMAANSKKMKNSEIKDKIPIWASPYLMGVIMFLLLIEWILRKIR